MPLDNSSSRRRRRKLLLKPDFLTLLFLVPLIVAVSASTLLPDPLAPLRGLAKSDNGNG
jgi:hypothetical protein